MRVGTLFFMFITIMVFTTGCWDEQELTDRAFIIATGLDRGDNGLLHDSAQVVVPANLGSPESGGDSRSSFQVFEADGKTLLDAADHLQAKLSRRVFKGHRRAIYIGQSLAEEGLRQELDEFTRNPEVRLRTDVFIVKDDSAANMIKQRYPFERVPAQAAMKIHKVLGGYSSDQTFAQFLRDNAADANCPTLPLISKDYEFVGRAIFNRRLKMVGQLSSEDAINRFWIVNLLRQKRLTAFVPQGKGYVTLSLTKLHSRITPVFQGKTVRRIDIDLNGVGHILENSTTLDVLREDDIAMIKHELEQAQTREVSDMVRRVQQQYRTDIFTFGQTIHRHHPSKWRTLKPKWAELFPNISVNVRVHLKFTQSGLSGRPLQIRKGN